MLIFVIIHRSHCTFWYYSWISLYYFSYILVLFTVFLAKSFQFQLNELFPNGKYYFANLFYYSAYFCYYLLVLLHFLLLFIDLTVLFQLTFTFIYNTFSKKISVLTK